MNNQEILNRFDVLYNNIMSDQAPGLDEYEKSVFWNKATVEVLKNHINPKGNKYGEGYDYSSKRQLDFSALTVEDSYTLFPQRVDRISSSTWRASVVKPTQDPDNANKVIYNIVDCNIDYLCMLSIINEYIAVANNELDFYVNIAKTDMCGNAVGFDVNGDGKIDISDVTKLADLIPETANFEALKSYLLGNAGENVVFVLENPKTPEEIIEENNIKTARLVVVPINHMEYDTLMSRPYKCPPKSQAWRLISNGAPEFIIDSQYAPYKYSIRYVRMPAEVDLSTDVGSEVPEILHDEILQRAVELAKNSWEGNIETTKAFGERSE